MKNACDTPDSAPQPSFLSTAVAARTDDAPLSEMIEAAVPAQVEACGPGPQGLGTFEDVRYFVLQAAYQIGQVSSFLDRLCTDPGLADRADIAARLCHSADRALSDIRALAERRIEPECGTTSPVVNAAGSSHNVRRTLRALPLPGTP